MVMIATALAAAVLYGAGAAVEQRQAALAPQSAAGRPRLLVRLVKQPLWLMGFAAQVGGFAAHAAALRNGSLASVQMLMATELVVAILVVRLWSGQPLGRASWAAALTVVAAIALFLAATATVQHHAPPRHEHAAALGAAVSGVAALAAAACGLREAGTRRAVLLAAAAGLADACSAVVTMAFAHSVGRSLATLVGSWSLYALVVVGLANVLLTQTAYQVGRPMVTLPVISAIVPVASVAIGVGLLGETPRAGVPGALAAGLAVLAASTALAYLARSAPHPNPYQEPGRVLAAEPLQEPRSEPQPVQVPEPRAAAGAHPCRS